MFDQTFYIRTLAPCLFAWCFFIGTGNLLVAQPLPNQTTTPTFDELSDEFADTLDEIKNYLLDHGDACSSATRKLERYAGEMKSRLSSVSIDENSSIAMLESIEKMIKISAILTKICENKTVANESKALVEQLSIHYHDMQKVYSSRNGQTVSELPETSYATYNQWKAGVLTLTQQVKIRADQKDWSGLEKLGDSIRRSCEAELEISVWDKFSRVERELINYERGRMALFGTILKEYAADENLPHVLYFHDKIVDILETLP